MATLNERERRAEAARRGQARAMEGRKCPDCNRGNALTQIRTDWAVGKNCRYCGWESIRLVEEKQ